MSHKIKVSLKYISAFFFAALFLLLTVESKDRSASSNAFCKSLTELTDTIKPIVKKDSAELIHQHAQRDSVIDSIYDKAGADTSINDSTVLVSKIDTFNFKISKDSLDAPIEYNAEDSMVLDVPSKKIILYGKQTKTHYKDNDLTAPIIELDQERGNIIASIKRDSLGKVIAMPNFKQGDFSSESDSIKFNMKTGKGITKSTYTQQGEMYVYGEVIKKIDNNVFYAKRARFTTCDLDTPHFAFVSNKIKFINKKMAITGPVHPEFEGVPVPLYLPFGIFPLSQGRHSGLLPPEFTANEQLGLGLEGLGYYKVLSDYWDVIYRANIYSYGGWTMNINPRYMKRYRYRGSLTFDIQNFKYNFKGDPDYTKNRSYHLTWNHSVDAKSRPGVNFSASVNAGSSSFNTYVPNNPVQNFQNSLNSSIVYSKTWRDKPFNLTISANHNQNTNLKLVNINLPDLAFNVSTIYPFRKQDFVGTPKWYENLGVAYNGNIKSLFSFYDTTQNIFSHILDTLQWGAHHSIPISLSLPQLGIFQISPSVSYEETWYQSKFIRSWDSTRKKVDTTITKGFYTARQMSFGLGVSTRIFGLIAAKDSNARIQAIRHEIRPTISFDYRPDLNKRNYYTTQIDTAAKYAQFAVFERNVFSPYSAGRFGGISFGIDNNIQMKVKNKKDTGEAAIKKVSLIDGLSLNGGYNLIADSFNFSNLNLAFRSSLFQKINITGGATLDPYDVNSKGERLKTLIWKRKPLSLGRLTSGQLSVSSSFQGGSKNGKQEDKSNPAQNNVDDENALYSNDEYQTELAYIRNNPGEFADFNIPWSLNFSYSLRFSKVYRADYSGFTTEYAQDVNLSGTLNLTPKWQIATNGSYNITQKQLGLVSVSLSREMHCWQMSISLSPVGRYRFFSINLSPKSGILKDLKVNRTRYSYDVP